MARPSRRTGNLPAEVTSFVGRRRELTELRKRLGEARLVTLVGPGGAGKTRLAIRRAAGAERGFPDGAWLIELAEVRDPALVADAALAALDLRHHAGDAPLPLLLSHLRDRKTLLVVDNCEHLLDAAAGLVSEVLRAAPGVRVIATSREPLSAPGEHVVPVPQLRQDDAVTLFTERAAAASGGFAPSEPGRAAVSDLCRRLDGLPLAIELAAVRTRALSVEQILDRLSDRFGLLTGGGRTALPRQRTLQTTIDWSHDLLSAGERTLLRRLCVFAGRFTIEDVEAVCAFAGIPGGRAFELLSSLVDRSLVIKEDAGTIACYRLHETMREYAVLRLRAAAEEEELLQRRAEYYGSRCHSSRAEARYRLTEWLEWMDLEIDNVRSVLRQCADGGDRELGITLVVSIGWYWMTRATSEGARWLDELLAPGDVPGPEGYFMRGFLAVLQSDPASARPMLARAAARAGEAGEAGLLSQSLSLAAIAAGMSGDAASGVRFAEEARAAAGELDDLPATLMFLQSRALGGLLTGDLDAVRPAAREGVRLSRAAGDLYSLSMMLLNLGYATLLAGDAAGARPLFTEALGIAHRIDDRVAQHLLLDGLACRAAEAGEGRLAARLLGAAETVRRGTGSRLMPFLGPLLARAGEKAAARLGADAYAAESAAGRRLDRQAAIELALGERARPAARPSGADAGGDAGGDASPLGRREAEVAHLVAEGLSNKQIGARLFISEHTVDTHIRNIFNKLGVKSRAQIAVWITSRSM